MENETHPVFKPRTDATANMRQEHRAAACTTIAALHTSRSITGLRNMGSVSMICLVYSDLPPPPTALLGMDACGLIKE